MQEISFVPTKQVNQLICWDCKKKICKGKDFVPYYHQDGNCTIEVKEGKKEKAFVKCRACYTKNSVLEKFQPCEVFSRIVGYIRPVQQWNPGKVQEWRDRVNFKV